MEGLELWLDHVARTHGPQSDRLLRGCIIQSLDDGRTGMWETMIKYRTIDANLVVILKPVR